MKYKLVGGWWFTWTFNSFWIRLGGGSWVEQAFPTHPSAPNPGYMYATGDGTTSDFVFNFNYTLNEAINAYPGTTLSAATVSMLTTGGLPNGLIRIAWNDGDGIGSLQIRFANPATPTSGRNVFTFHDILRMTPDITTAIVVPAGGAGTVTGSRVSGYSFYPIRYMMEDLDEYDARIMQSIPDVGTPQTVLTSFRTKHRIGVRLDKAYPRSILDNEYYQFKDFMDHAVKGRPFRLYPDVTVSGAYAPITTPFGYNSYVLDKGSASWSPEPASGNWYKVLDTNLTAWEI